MPILNQIISYMAETLAAELANYKDKHFQARSETQYFLHYMVRRLLLLAYYQVII